MTTETGDGFEGWAVLELMGHRRMAGLLSVEERCGHSFIRIDIPAQDGDGFAATQWYSPQAVYAVTPTIEEVARQFARANLVAPIKRYELALPALAAGEYGDDE